MTPIKQPYYPKKPYFLIVAYLTMGLVPFYFFIKYSILFFNGTIRISEGGLLLILILFSLTTICLILIYRINIFFFVDEKVIIKTVWGTSKQKVRLNDIVTFKTIHQPKNQKTIFYVNDNTKFILNKGINYYDYQTIKSLLTIHKPIETVVKVDAKVAKNKISSLMALVMTILCSLFSVYLYVNKSVGNLNANEITYLVGTLSKKLEIDSDAKNHRSIEIQLHEYSNNLFSINYSSYSSIMSPEVLVENSHIGDSVRIGISKEDMKVKIIKNIKPTLGDYLNSYIFVFTITLNNNEYSSLESYNQISNADNDFGKYAMPLISIGFLIMTIYYRRKIANA